MTYQLNLTKAQLKIILVCLRHFCEASQLFAATETEDFGDLTKKLTAISVGVDAQSI